MAVDVPDIRLVILLRDPVERAYSHYKERLRNGGEALDFEDALDAEPARLQGEAERIVAEPGYHSVAHEDHSYVAQGRYLDMLPRWFELFPPEQFTSWRARTSIKTRIGLPMRCGRISGSLPSRCTAGNATTSTKHKTCPPAL